MRPLASPFTVANSWVLPVSLMATVVGVMAAGAWVTGTARADRQKAITGDQGDRIYGGTIDVQDRYIKLNGEVDKLRKDKTKLENAVSNTSGTTKVLNDALQDTKKFAGLTAVSGPGIMVTLKDSAKAPTTEAEKMAAIIHDADVQRVVNELYAAGAEAISVNDHRLSARSCVRCVGPVIRVDDNAIASPIKIRAIGDKDAMSGGLNTPGGLVSLFDPSQIQIETVKYMTLPAYTGSTGFKFAKEEKER